MGVLNQIEQMQNQGLPEEEIARRLRQGGISPKEIIDGFNQLEIKNNVSKNSDMVNSAPQYDDNSGGDEMQASVMGTEQEEVPSKNYYQPKSQEISERPVKNYYTPSPQEEQVQQSEEQAQGYYQEQSYGNSSGEGYNTDTIIEIAEQIFAERSQEIQRQIKNLTEFSALAQMKISETSERLKRIEMIIDRLQLSVLEKVGTYGQNLESVRKEMSMMQDSFSKALNPIMDRKSERVIQPEKIEEKIIPKKIKR